MQKTCGQQVVRKYLSLVNKCDNYMCKHFDKQLTNFLEITDCLAENEISVEAIEDDITNIKKQDLPSIAQVKGEEKEHFVLITKVGKKKVYYYDPNYEMCSCKIEEFASMSTNKFIISKEKKKHKTKVKLPSFFSKLQIFYISAFVLLELIFSIGLFMYIDFYRKAPLLVTSLIGIIGTIIGHVAYLIKLNKSINKNIIFKYTSENRLSRAEQFKTILRTKNEAFYKFNIALINISTLLYCFIISAIKDYRETMFIIMFCLVFLCLNYLIETNIKNLKKRQLTGEYLMFKNFKNGNDCYIDNYNAAEKVGTKYTLLKYMPILATCSMVILYQLVLVFTNSKYSVTMFIFYSGLYLVSILYTYKSYNDIQYLDEYRNSLLYLDTPFLSYLHK